jgi:hypothetical protein
MKIYLGVAGGVVVLLIVGAFVFRAVSRNSRLAPFRKNMDKYLATNQSGGGGYNTFEKGKALPIDMNAKDVDSIFFEMPASVVAQSPEEVGVVAHIKYATQPVAHYKGGAAVNQDFCLISMYDYPAGNMLTGVIRFEDRKPSVRGSPEDPDRRSLQTKMIEYFSSLKPGVPVDIDRPR